MSVNPSPASSVDESVCHATWCSPSPRTSSDSDPDSLHSHITTLGLKRLHIDGIHVLDTSHSIENLGRTLHTPAGHTFVEMPRGVDGQGSPDQEPQQARSFQKWVRSLQRRARQRPSVSATDTLPRWFWAPEYVGKVSPRPSTNRMSSSSGSSFRFVSAVRSASVSLASISVVTRSKRNATLSQAVSRTDHGSGASASGHRISEDSLIIEKDVLHDAAATELSIQRRRILEELVNTEEAYIGDVRFLMNVYITILASLPAMCIGLRSSINKNLAEIVELHEKILGDLHRVVPHSEYTLPQIPVSIFFATNSAAAEASPGHRRWTSLDGTLDCNERIKWLHSVHGALAEPQVAAEAAKVFAKKMNRFFIYKEYGAKYELMMKDVASADQTLPQWESYQKGLEALASTLGSAKNAEEKARKALTIGDLLVKLSGGTMNCQDGLSSFRSPAYPESVVLMRLREIMDEINRATDNTMTKAILERTWLLQDRLVFPHKRLDAAAKNRVRSFGQVRLCGTLYACWQTPLGVDGQYLICLLYRDILCLASAGKADPIYIIQACINLNGSSVEEADNGRGMQCHTAPFSWKLVFECNHHLYEMMLTACTPKEELEWRTRLARSVSNGSGSSEPKEPMICSSLDLNIKSLGSVFGKPGTMARRVSIHRATTVGPKSPLCQVVLKNTSVVRDSGNMASAALTINRSQSLLTTQARMPVLAPVRSERARLEALLADVWTRESLPFPGMTTRARSEHLVRASASTIMRKFSVTSIANSLSRKSVSLSQRSKSVEDSLCRMEVKGRRWKGSSDDGLSECRTVSADSVGRTKKRRRTGPRCLQGDAKQVPFGPDVAAGSEDAGYAATVNAVGEARVSRVISAHSLRARHSEKRRPGQAKDHGHHEQALEERSYSGRWAKSVPFGGRDEGSSHRFKGFFR